MERSNLNMTEDTEESEWIDVQPRKKKKRGLCHFHKREEAAATLAAVSAASATPPAGPPAPATPPADTPAPVTPAAAAQPKALPRAPTAATRFKVNGPSPVDFINRLNDPRLSFIAKPNRYGDFILYSKNENTSHLLSQHDRLEPLREATRKAVILHYPLQLPLDLVQSLPDVLTVYRCTNKAKEPLRKLIATFRGTFQRRLTSRIGELSPQLTTPLNLFDVSSVSGLVTTKPAVLLRTTSAVSAASVIQQKSASPS